MNSHLKPVGFHSGGLLFQVILISLGLSTPAAVAEQRNASAPWKDQSTGLTWTTADNGSGVSWHQAARYCSELRRGGHADWRLPSIDELQSIFGGSENDSGRHVRGPIKITGWEWSSTPGQQEGEGWVFDFGDGGRASAAAGDSGLNRALCVRTGSRRP